MQWYELALKQIHQETLVVFGIEYRYLLMRTWRPTGEINVYQKNEKHTHSLFFNRIAVKKNFQKVWDRNKFTLVALIPILKSWITFSNSRLERVNKKLLTPASSLCLTSLKSIFFVLDCRYYKSLIKHVYQLPPPPALLIIVFVSRLLCAVRWTQIFFVYLSTKYLTITDRFKTLLRSKS